MLQPATGVLLSLWAQLLSATEDLVGATDATYSGTILRRYPRYHSYVVLLRLVIFP